MGQFPKIINFAVESDYKATACRQHGLRAGGRQILDRQATVPEGDARCGIHPNTPGVGSTMLERVDHPLRDRIQRVSIEILVKR